MTNPIIPPARPALRPRGAFTLIELMVVIVLLSVVVGGLVQMLAGQQRFYRSAGELMESRSQIRQAASILPADLRGVSISGGDILAASDTSIDFMTTFASTIVCTAGGNAFGFPPSILQSGQTLTSGRWRAAVGDIVMVYNGGPSTKANDDTWTRYTITGTADIAGFCPTGVPSVANSYVSAADAAQPSFVVMVDPAISATHEIGSPVRVLRRVQYALYAASDGEWYLGYRDCAAGPCSAIQPVSGPYRSFVGTGDGRNGLQFTYFDTLGVQLDPANNAGDLTRIGSVRITVRGETASAMALPGMPRAPKQDTMQVFVGMRNRT